MGTYTRYKVWDNGEIVEVWKMINNYIPHFTGHVIMYPCLDYSLSILVKGDPGSKIKHNGVTLQHGQFLPNKFQQTVQKRTREGDTRCVFVELRLFVSSVFLEISVTLHER